MEETASLSPSVSYSLFECQECSSVVLGIHDGSAELSCHGEPMDPVDDSGIDHEDPDLDQLLTDVYGTPKMMMDMCHFVFEEGTVSVSDVAEHFGYERDTISDSLRELAGAGFLEQHSLNREDGGEVRVYSAKPVEETRRGELLGLLHWAGTSARILDEANQIKARCVEREDGLDQIFWDVYETERTL